MIPHRLLQVFEWLNIFRGIISLVNCEFFHASSNCFHVQMIWSTANNCKVSLQCELPYAASSGLNTQMTWYILNNCRVSLLCDFLHDSLDRLLVQMICYTANNCKVSLQCEFLHASLNRMHVQRIYYTANNCRVRVHCFALVSRQNVMVHNKEEPCSECTMLFSRSSSLKRCTRAHVGILYCCSKCTKSWSQLKKQPDKTSWRKNGTIFETPWWKIQLVNSLYKDYSCRVI